MTINLCCRDHDENEVLQSVVSILNENYLCSLATVNPDGTGHISICYFAFDDILTLVFLSSPSSRHCRNTEINSRASIAVFSPDQPWGECDLKGMQLFGTVSEATGERLQMVDELYRTRFSGYARWIDGLEMHEKSAIESRFYCFKTDSLKLLDEGRFGEDVYVTASLCLHSL